MWLYMFKCDVYAQLLVDQTQKDFWVFICFWKWFYTFVLLVFFFFSKYSVVFFFKNMFRGCFVRSSRLRASRERCLREINFLTIHTETSTTVSRLYRDSQLLAKCCLAKIGFFQIQIKAIAVVLLLSCDLQLLAKVFVLQRSLSRVPRDWVATI